MTFCPLDLPKGPGGFFVCEMVMTESAGKPVVPHKVTAEVADAQAQVVIPPGNRVTAFFDAQNIFFAAKAFWGYNWVNFDPQKLAAAVCATQAGWNLTQVRFYTGTPDQRRDYNGNMFWQNKLRAMSRNGVVTFNRKLVYRSEEHEFSDGSIETIDYEQEKGIDVRIALDMLSLFFDGDYDIALLFSQDQDLAEAVSDVHKMADARGVKVLVASAFPHEAGSGRNQRGVSGTLQLPIDKATYDKCIDPYDYRPKLYKGPPPRKNR